MFVGNFINFGLGNVRSERVKEAILSFYLQEQFTLTLIFHYNLDSFSPSQSSHRWGTGVLWIYGDSHNRRLFESLQSRRLCYHVFMACYHSDAWVYLLGPVNSDEMDLRCRNVIVLTTK